MGLIKQSREARADKAGERARAAWDEGLACYIHKFQAMGALSDDALSRAVSEILELGWRLHSTAAVFNTVGINTTEMYFTFLR
jgi:hypothetical protein